MMFSDNVLLLSDSYKVSHYKQYPPNTSKVYSYFESRHTPFDIIFFGLQYILKRYLSGRVVTQAKIFDAKNFCLEHFGQDLFNQTGWTQIAGRHEGRLPLSIRAIPEGMRVRHSCPLIVIENTDKEAYWLTNFVESLLVQVWYPTTVASLSNFLRKYILTHLRESGTPETINSKLHDFGFRGVSSVESAALGGAGHLLNFDGSDNLVAALFAREYYGEPMASMSIPASEHSTMTAWGRGFEVEAFRNMLIKYPKGTVACVSDSYNIFEACKLWGSTLKREVLEREGTLVIRPDSGQPEETVLRVLEILGSEEYFGTSENQKGYRVLPDKVRIIQGDGVDDDSICEILERMKLERWSADNISFGMGGGLLQKLHRDTCKFAFKCSYIEVDGHGRDVYKDPVGDYNKRSKRGRLKLIQDDDGKLKTVSEGSPGDDLLVEIFRDGEMLATQAFADIRDRARA